MEFARDIGKYGINIMLTTTFWGLGFTIGWGDYSVVFCLNLLFLHLTLFIDKDKWLDG